MDHKINTFVVVRLTYRSNCGRCGEEKEGTRSLQVRKGFSSREGYSHEKKETQDGSHCGVGHFLLNVQKVENFGNSDWSSGTSVFYLT